MSVLPPGGAGETILIILLGYWASAGAVPTASASTAKNVRTPAPVIASPRFRQLQRREMVIQNFWHFLRRNATEAAIGCKTEVRQRPARGGKPLLEAGHAVNEPEIDPRLADLQSAERRVEVIVG